MTSEQREILCNLIEGEAEQFGYTITTVEYPCDLEGSLKVVTRQYDPSVRMPFMYVDIYGRDGRTISTESRPCEPLGT